MKVLWFVIAAVVGAIVFCLAVVIACCRIAGQCSCEEGLTLKPCPVCKKIPQLGYACGEYFVAGDDSDCPGCGTEFSEMHSSKQLEIEAWNMAVKVWNKEIIHQD